jgi:hypothetical protein
MDEIKGPGTIGAGFGSLSDGKIDRHFNIIRWIFKTVRMIS